MLKEGSVIACLKESRVLVKEPKWPLTALTFTHKGILTYVGTRGLLCQSHTFPLNHSTSSKGSNLKKIIGLHLHFASKSWHLSPMICTKKIEFFLPSCIVTTNHHTVGPRSDCAQNSIFCIGFSVWLCNSQIPGYAIGWLEFTTNGVLIDAIHYISKPITKVMVNFLCHKLPSSNWEVFSYSEE
jgi:hypothetical protein